MLLLPLSCIKPVAITMLAVCDISIISTYVTAAEEKLDQSQTDKAYLYCWNNLQCRQHIDQSLTQLTYPTVLIQMTLGFAMIV